MKRPRLVVVTVVLVAALAASIWWSRRAAGTLALTGIVTTHEVVVSAQIPGQVARLLVAQGDSVQGGQLLAELAPGELTADRDYFASTAGAMGAQVLAGEADLRYQSMETEQQIRQASSALDAALAQQQEAEATLANARTNREREDKLLSTGGASPQEADQARTAFSVAQARFDAAVKQVETRRSALVLAQGAAAQLAARRNSVVALRQQRSAASAQTAKADVRLAYREIRAPIGGIIDVDAVRTGEVVTAGQPMLTLIDPDHLWVRADVEETYIDRVRLGDTLQVRLPWGETAGGQVIFRGVDAEFATQRDVSRTKRDIRTFEIRVRLDNSARRLAVGMTTTVFLPVRAHEAPRMKAPA